MNKVERTAAATRPDFAIAAIVLDPDGICSFATAEARTMFAPREPLGHTLQQLFHDWSGSPHDLEPRGTPTLHRRDGRVVQDDRREMPDGSIQVVLTDISAHAGEGARAAYHEPAGLLSRAALQARIDQSIAHARAADTLVAVHHIDLDRFKSVNASIGHAIGDALLLKVADRLDTLLQGGDVAGRIGGDEFVLVQTSVRSNMDAQVCAERIVDLIGRSYVLRGHVLNIGASVGVALSSGPNADAETLLRHADLALYRAKAEGRGTTRFFEPEMQARTIVRRALETDLRLALAKRQFHLHYQPLHNLESDRITGFEALLRWTHSERGAVPPLDFIPLAEEIGLIDPIGRWVLRTACREAACWPEPASVAVNISPHQFKGGHLVEDVMGALAASGLSADRLELEITEGALLEETTLVLRALNQLRELGVRISMDDFGTGYSSLSYIRKFPFDKIKIDQSFVRGLGVDGECDAILRAVSTLGASLGMRTTAEGVETSDQLSRIRQEGCTEVQGYLTGRPLAAGDVRALLERQKEQ